MINNEFNIEEHIKPYIKEASENAKAFLPNVDALYRVFYKNAKIESFIIKAGYYLEERKRVEFLNVPRNCFAITITRKSNKFYTDIYSIVLLTKNPECFPPSFKFEYLQRYKLFKSVMRLNRDII